MSIGYGHDHPCQDDYISMLKCCISLFFFAKEMSAPPKRTIDLGDLTLCSSRVVQTLFGALFFQNPSLCPHLFFCSVLRNPLQKVHLCQHEKITNFSDDNFFSTRTFVLRFTNLYSWVLNSRHTFTSSLFISPNQSLLESLRTSGQILARCKDVWTVCNAWNLNIS